MKKILLGVFVLLESASSKNVKTPAALISELNFLIEKFTPNEISEGTISLPEDNSELVLFDSEEFDNELRTRQTART